jgi:TatD DNase family protein
MIDTHAHLDFSQFDNDREPLIEECRRNGVQFIVNIGVDLQTSKASVKLSEEYDFIYAAVGYHPHDSKEMTDSVFDEISQLATHPKVVAIGEIGLDYYRDMSPRDIQQVAFIRQLQLAERLKKPVVLHIRQAMEPAYEILRKHPGSYGVLHAFPGNAKEAAEGVKMGYMIAFGGPITYPNSQGPQVASALPLSKIVTETDCPYLPPQQFRGQRNRPDYVGFVLDKLTELFPRYSRKDIDRITTKNAAQLFKLPVDDSPELAYMIGKSLYLNLTSRCTNNCYFCPRNSGFHVAGHNLRLNREPDESEIQTAIAKYSEYDEIVFCGIGEPTLRTDLMLSLAAKLKLKKLPIRLNTNGQGSLIAKADLPSKLRGLIDSVSISLNAQDEAIYTKICNPQFGPKVYAEILKFAQRCKDEGIKTAFSIVTVPEIDIAACQQIADRMNIPLRKRNYASD